MAKKLPKLAFLLGIMVPVVGQASLDTSIGSIQIGRYASERLEATKEQADLLEAVVHIRFPRSIITVGDALDYLLLRSGYRLADVQASDPAMVILTTRPLPEVHREMGPMTLEDALVTLAGSVYRLVVDPLNRLVSFEVTEQYKPLVPEDNKLESLARKEIVRRHEGHVANSAANPGAHNTIPTEARERLKHELMEKLNVQPEDFAPVDAAYEGGELYGPVKATETLYEIAHQYGRKMGVSAHKVVYGLYQQNPDAFGSIGGTPNINRLLQGVTLNMPSQELLSQIQLSEALGFISEHNEQWMRYVEGIG